MNQKQTVGRWQAFLALLGFVALVFSACGYQFQHTVNPLKKLGIQKIYVEIFENRTLFPGVEHFFTTAMVREISHSKSFQLVNQRAAADAILKGSVYGAQNTPSTIQVKLEDASLVSVANTFYSKIRCAITMVDRDGKVILSRTFVRNKNHPAALVLDSNFHIKKDANVTAPLINNSEQRITYRFLAKEMMSNAYQYIIGVF